MQQRCCHERRLGREVGAELHAAESNRAAPRARRADGVADAQGREPVREVQGPRGVEPDRRCEVVGGLPELGMRGDAARPEHAQLQDAACALRPFDPLAECVVVDEAAEVRGGYRWRVGGCGLAASGEKRVRRQVDTRALRGLIERDGRAELLAEARVLLTVDHDQAVLGGLQTQPRQVGRANPQSPVGLPAADQGAPRRLLVDGDLQDGRFRRRRPRHRHGIRRRALDGHQQQRQQQQATHGSLSLE